MESLTPQRQGWVVPPIDISQNLAETARLGADIYERCIKSTLRAEDDGKFVAVDVVTGEHEIDASDYEAVTRLHERVPGAEVMLLRVGHLTAYRMLRSC